MAFALPGPEEMGEGVWSKLCDLGLWGGTVGGQWVSGSERAFPPLGEGSLSLSEVPSLCRAGGYGPLAGRWWSVESRLGTPVAWVQRP